MKTKITKKTVIIIILFLFIFFAFYNFVFIKRNYSQEEYNAIIKYDMQHINTHIKMYFIETGSYPPNLDALREKYSDLNQTNPFGNPYILDTNELVIKTINDKNNKIKLNFYIPR